MKWVESIGMGAVLYAPEITKKTGSSSYVAQLRSLDIKRAYVPMLWTKAGRPRYLPHLKDMPDEELKLQLEWLVMMEYGE